MMHVEACTAKIEVDTEQSSDCRVCRRERAVVLPPVASQSCFRSSEARLHQLDHCPLSAEDEQRERVHYRSRVNIWDTDMQYSLHSVHMLSVHEKFHNDLTCATMHRKNQKGQCLPFQYNNLKCMMIQKMCSRK